MTHVGAVELVDENGAAYGVKHVENKIRVSSMPYLYDIAEGNISGHSSWYIFGYTPAVGLTESDIWSKGGTYVFPTSAQQMEIVSSDNTQDIGTVIKGDAVDNTVQADADGTTTTLEDDSVDFTAATSVAIGDCVILDPHGGSPSWGYVTAVATHTLTVAGGFAKGYSAASRYYAVIDVSAHTGAMAVGIQYLTSSYVRKGEIVVLNGTTAVDTVGTDIFRINDFRILLTGSGLKTVGNISLRDTAGTTTYNHITLGYNIARSAIYTVPDGFVLYVTQVSMGFGYAANQTHYARLYIRSNEDPTTAFHTINTMYPEMEAICANSQAVIPLLSPIRFDEHTDIKASGIASAAAGVGNVVMRGWLETSTGLVPSASLSPSASESASGSASQSPSASESSSESASPSPSA